VPGTRGIELELQILEAKCRSFESKMALALAVAEYNLSGSGYSDLLDGQVKYLTSERDKVAVATAEKKLDLFELQGA